MQARQAEEERFARQEVDVDYMAPFLSALGNPDMTELTSEQAHKLREMCLMDCKKQMVHRAEMIHARFERVSV